MYAPVGTAVPTIKVVGEVGMYAPVGTAVPTIKVVGEVGAHNSIYDLFPVVVDAVGSLVYVPTLLTLSTDCARPWITLRLEQHLPTIRIWPQVEVFADEAATILLDRADATVNPERWQLDQWGTLVPFPAAGILPKGGEQLTVQIEAGPKSAIWIRVMLGVLEV